MHIDPLIPEILDDLRQSPNLVLQAAPGAGKTTRVPPALLPIVSGEVWVLEPRRLAARMAARRVASEMGERVGDTAGYQVRFEEIAGPKTRLRFMTEGVLTRKLLSNPALRNVAAVVLDEGTDGAAWVYPGVVPEAPILDGDDGVSQVKGNLGQPHRFAVDLAVQVREH